MKLIPGRTYFRHKATGTIWGYNALYKSSDAFEEVTVGTVQEEKVMQPITQPEVVVDEDEPEESLRRPEIDSQYADDLSSVMGDS